MSKSEEGWESVEPPFPPLLNMCIPNELYIFYTLVNEIFHYHNL